MDTLLVFLQALHTRRKILLTFYSKEDDAVLVRTCAPLDYGPSRRGAGEGPQRYHFWDYTSDVAPHTLSLLPEQVRGMTLLEEFFRPEEVVTWESPWWLARAW